MKNLRKWLILVQTFMNESQTFLISIMFIIKAGSGEIPYKDLLCIFFIVLFYLKTF